MVSCRRSLESKLDEYDQEIWRKTHISRYGLGEADHATEGKMDGTTCAAQMKIDLALVQLFERFRMHCRMVCVT